MMSDWYKDEGSWIKVLLAGAVAGAIVVALAWWGSGWYSSSAPDPQRAVVHSEHSSNEPVRRSTGASEATSELALCQSVYDDQTAPLETAAHSLDQWEVHVGAMNKLVMGAITLGQAQQFWNRTRVGAQERLHEFATARDQYNQRIFRCPASGQVEGPSDLESCHRAVAARGRTLRLAATALTTWGQHVHHMEMLRSGAMTPEEATRLWLQSWRQGDREIAAYRAAARASEDLSC